jgi:hypothetical protein
MLTAFHLNCPLLLSESNETSIFANDVGKILKIKLTKTVVARAGWFHADRQTELLKLIAAFRKFAKAPKLL